MAQKSLLSFYKISPPNEKKRSLKDEAEVESKKMKYPSSIASSKTNSTNNNNSTNIEHEWSTMQDHVDSFPGNGQSSHHQNLTFTTNNTTNDANNSNFEDSLPKLVITQIPLKGGELSIITNFLSTKKSKELLEWFLKLDWSSTKQSDFVIYDKVVKRPRKTKFFGVGVSGDYNVKEHEWPAELLEIKNMVEQATNHSFNFVLVNYYRDGQDSIAAHADREIVIGQNPVIASLSLGATRDFILRHKTLKEKKILPLFSGSLLVMRGVM